MPFNKIMDLLQLSLLIFSLTTCRVLGETPWGHNQARYNGYDLRRGPVFYEVYYANENWPSPRDQRQALDSPRPERQYANDGRILEKTYQAADDSYYNAPREANFAPQEEAVVDRHYAQRKRPMNILPYGRDMLVNTREYTGGENNERYQATGQFGNFVEGNEGRYPPAGLLQDLDSRTNLMESKADRTDDSPSSYASRKFEDDYIRPLLSAIESSAREILEKQIRRESLAQMGNTAKTSRSPRFAGSEIPVDQAGLGMRVVLTRHADTPSHSENFDSVTSSFESADWRSKNQRINDLSMDQSHLPKPYDQRGSIRHVPFVPKEDAFEPRTQAGNSVISETLAPANEQSFFPATASPGQRQQSQPSNPNYQPPRSYSQNLIEEAEKEMEKGSEKTPIVASIEVSEVTRHRVRHHHGEKPRHKHRHHHGEAGH